MKRHLFFWDLIFCSSHYRNHPPDNFPLRISISSSLVELGQSFQVRLTCQTIMGKCIELHPSQRPLYTWFEEMVTLMIKKISTLNIWMKSILVSIFSWRAQVRINLYETRESFTAFPSLCHFFFFFCIKPALYFYLYQYSQAFLVAQTVKNLSAMWETWV